MIYNNDPTKAATKATIKPPPTELDIALLLEVLPLVVLVGLVELLEDVPLRALARLLNAAKFCSWLSSLLTAKTIPEPQWLT